MAFGKLAFDRTTFGQLTHSVEQISGKEISDILRSIKRSLAKRNSAKKAKGTLISLGTAVSFFT